LHTNNSAVLSFYDYVSNPAAVETSEHQTNSKVVAPKQHSDFRPILITPVLTRIMERTVVQAFLYTAFLSPPQSLSFSNQFDFRPTGSHETAI